MDRIPTFRPSTQRRNTNVESKLVFRPSPYEIGLAALISLHNHHQGEDEDSALHYQPGEAEAVDRFLQDVLFFSKQDKQITREKLRVTHLIQELAQYMDHDHREEVPRKLLAWYMSACSSLDAFFDFCATASNSESSTGSASAAGMFRRSIQQQWEHLAFMMIGKLFAEFRKQVEEANTALLDSTSTISSIPSTIDSTLGNRTPYGVLVVENDANITPSSQQQQESWHAFVLHLQNNERVGATAALHQYIDHHGEEALRTAGFLQVGLAQHFGASTAMAKREAERVVQQHGGESVLVEEEQEPNTNEDFEDTLTRTVDPCASPAERRAALVNRALSVFNGPAGMSSSGPDPSATTPTNLYIKALSILAEEDKAAILQTDAGYALLHEWAVRRQDWAAAQAWRVAYKSSSTCARRTSTTDWISQRALYLSRRGDWQAATQLLEPHPTLLLQFAETYVYAGQYVAALAPLLQYISQHKHSAAATILLATVHLEFLNDPQRANMLVRAALPVAKQSEHVCWQAQAYWVLARSGETGCIGRCLQLFRLLDDVARLRDVYYFAAQHYNEEQQYEKRDQAATEFVRLDSEAETELPLLSEQSLLQSLGVVM